LKTKKHINAIINKKLWDDMNTIAIDEWDKSFHYFDSENFSDKETNKDDNSINQLEEDDLNDNGDYQTYSSDNDDDNYNRDLQIDLLLSDNIEYNI
jgi:hypothetical protein